MLLKILKEIGLNEGRKIDASHPPSLDGECDGGFFVFGGVYERIPGMWCMTGDPSFVGRRGFEAYFYTWIITSI